MRHQLTCHNIVILNGSHMHTYMHMPDTHKHTSTSGLSFTGKFVEICARTDKNDIGLITLSN